MSLLKRTINPGLYRHSIVINAAPTDATRNSYGERTAIGATVATVWASKEDWSGREIVEGEQETPMIYTRFYVRWRSDVQPDMTVTLGTDVYRIDSVMDMDGTQRELVLMCKRNDAE